MYNVLLYNDYDCFMSNDGDFTRVTFDTLDEAYEWAKKAIEQGCIAAFIPLED